MGPNGDVNVINQSHSRYQYTWHGSILYSYICCLLCHSLAIILNWYVNIGLLHITTHCTENLFFGIHTTKCSTRYYWNMWIYNRGILHPWSTWLPLQPEWSTYISIVIGHSRNGVSNYRSVIQGMEHRTTDQSFKEWSIELQISHSRNGVSNHRSVSQGMEYRTIVKS